MGSNELISEERAKLLDTVSEALFDARKRAGLSQEKMAMRIDTEAAYVSRIERGKHVPSLYYLQKITQALGCSADYLLGISSYHRLAKKGSIDDQLLAALDTMDIEEKFRLLEMIDKNKKGSP